MEIFFEAMKDAAEFAVWILLALMLAFLVETLVEYFLGLPFDYLPEKFKIYKKPILTYVAAGAGIFLCLFFKIDLLYVLTTIACNLADRPPILAITSVGMVITGFAVGHGSSYLHDFLKKHWPGKPLAQG